MLGYRPLLVGSDVSVGPSDSQCSPGTRADRRHVLEARVVVPVLRRHLNRSPFAWYGPELACNVQHGGGTGRHFVGEGIPRPDVADC